jgi:hypothetical protein
MIASMIILYLNVKHDFNWDLVYQCIKNKTDHPTHEEVIELFKEKNINPNEWVCLLDDGYPEILKRISRPPFVLNTTTDTYFQFCQLDALFNNLISNKE